MNNRKIFNFIISCQFALYRNLPAPGLGAKPGASKDADKKKFRPDDYITPPKVPQMSMAKLKAPAKKVESAAESATDTTVVELPPEIADPHKSPCVNVPEWFVKEGGELLLSETPNGKSTMVARWLKPDF